MLKISDEEALKHITAFEAPPEGFDPKVAEDRLLRKHGIPRRPDAKLEPLLRSIWDKTFATKPRFIKAEIAIDQVMAKRKRPVLKPGRGGDGRGLRGPAVAAVFARVAGRGGAGGPGRASVRRGNHVGQPGMRLLAGARGAAGAAAGEGRATDPRRGHDPGPGNSVPVGQGAGRGPQVRGAPRLERRWSHRVHAGQFVRGLRSGQVPDQPGGPAQRHRVPLAGPRRHTPQADRRRAGPPGR